MTHLHKEPCAEKVRTTHVLGGATVRFGGGVQRRVRLFASRVDHSGACRVSLVSEVRAEAIARRMRDHFESLGGVPDVATFDAPVATSPAARGRIDGDHASLVAAMKGIGVEVSHRGRHEGRLLEEEVRSTFFEGQRFADRRDLEEKIAAWCEVISLRQFGRSGEHVGLKPLAVGPDGFAVPVDVVVGGFGVVLIAGHSYVVPAATGTRGTALLYPTVVRLMIDGGEILLRRRVSEAPANTCSTTTSPPP